MWIFPHTGSSLWDIRDNSAASDSHPCWATGTSASLFSNAGHGLYSLLCPVKGLSLLIEVNQSNQAIQQGIDWANKNCWHNPAVKGWYGWFSTNQICLTNSRTSTPHAKFATGDDAGFDGYRGVTRWRWWWCAKTQFSRTIREPRSRDT